MIQISRCARCGNKAHYRAGNMEGQVFCPACHRQGPWAEDGDTAIHNWNDDQALIRRGMGLVQAEEAAHASPSFDTYSNAAMAKAVSDAIDPT